MSDNRHRDHRNDGDIDVDIDQALKFELEQETDIEVATESKTKSEYVVDVDAEDADVDVYIDINENKHVREEHEIRLEEHVRKDVDIDIDENVDKNVDINVWETKVEVDAKNIMDGTDNDVNDIDSQELIDVGYGGRLEMDDFAARNLAIGKSFNGSGNDGQYSLTQSNNLTDNDKLIAPSVAFFGFDGSNSVDGLSDFWNPHGGHKGGVEPFQKVEVEGGEASAGDGIDGDSDADENDGNGSVSGEALASADGIANVAAFTQDILMGGNQQANFAAFDVVGGDRVQANDIKGDVGNGGGDWNGHGGGHSHGDDHHGGLAMRDTDNDVNDLDAQELIHVSPHAELSLDDFRLDTIAIGESFNGPGNDMQYDVVQVNDLLDNDFLYRPEVKYVGPGGVPFQDVEVKGGEAYAGDGIDGDSSASQNGLDGSVAGATAASADAIADVKAFTQNIVMGANLQVNDLSASVVGGNSTIADNIDING